MFDFEVNKVCLEQKYFSIGKLTLTLMFVVVLKFVERFHIILCLLVEPNLASNLPWHGNNVSYTFLFPFSISEVSHISYIKV